MLQKGAEPISIKGNKTLVILLHGFTASPFEMREFGYYLHKNLSCSIQIPLISGHGVNERLLNQTSYQEFINPIDELIQVKSKDYDKIILIGMSMGGSIALYLASKYKFDAVICLATPIYLPHSVHFLSVALWFKRFIDKHGGPDIADKSRLGDLVSLSKIPLKALLEFKIMLKKLVQPNLIKIDSPLLLFHSKNDHTIYYKNMEKIRTSVSSKIVECHTLEKSFHILSLDFDKEFIFEATSEFIKRF
jgi:carboxylesterase